MGESQEWKQLLARMRHDWEQRAAQNAEKFVYTHDWDTDTSEFGASGRVNYEQLVRPYLPVLLCGRPPKSCRVVEIGCGVGRMTRCFAEEFQEVHAVDISAEMIRLGREQLGSFPNAFLHVGSGEDLRGLPDQYFDLAFSYLVFQHIPSRGLIENYIREAARVLRAGGAFLFQLNGYQTPDYQRQEKDTWMGESFSFVEATQVLARTGFYPLAASGAGTQYFLLAARRAAAEPVPLSSYILPGEWSAPEQLVEGWGETGQGDCRAIGPRCRTILAVPAAPDLRLFVTLYLGPGKSIPRTILTVKVNETVIGSARIERDGDYFFQWPIPATATLASRAAVTMELDPAEGISGLSVRSLGIYASGDSTPAPGARQRELEERAAWTRELDAQLQKAHRQIEARQKQLEEILTWARERDLLASRAQELHAELERTAACVRSLEEELEKARHALAVLQVEFDERTNWAQSLETALEESRQNLAFLQGEFDERTAWAQSLEAALEKSQQNLAVLQVEFDERTAWAQRLDAEVEAARADLRLLFGSFWYRVGKKLGLLPVPPSDKGRGTREKKSP